MFYFIRKLFKSQLLGSGRSGKWPTVRKQHLENNPLCAVCNEYRKVEVHHIVPFNVDPDLELDPENLITLCEKNKCHIMIGHLGSYKSFNREVVKDAKYLNNKIINRP